MSNATESQQRAMNRIISNIASIQSLFPVLWDPVDNIPQATWPDRLGLVDRPESAWDRIQRPPVSLRLQEFQASEHLAEMLNRQVYVMGGQANYVYGSQPGFRRVVSSVATIQSLFPDLWDQAEDRAAPRNRLEDAVRRPDSPWNRVQPYVPFAAQQRDFLGPIGRPQLAEENEEDEWSESESEFDEDWESDYDCDSGIDSGTDTESNASLEHREDNVDEDRGFEDQPNYIDKEYYCPSCDGIYVLRHYIGPAGEFDRVD